VAVRKKRVRNLGVCLNINIVLDLLGWADAAEAKLNGIKVQVAALVVAQVEVLFCKAYVFQVRLPFTQVVLF